MVHLMVSLPERAYDPGLHISQLDAPALVVIWPSGQKVHPVIMELAAYLPGEQDEQLVAPADG